MPARVCFSIAVLALALGGPGADAQQSNAAPLAKNQTVRLNVIVADHSGNRISGLKAQDFSLLDNKMPKAIASFRELNGRSESEAPVHVLIVVDAVNTPFSAVAYQRDQIAKYLRGNEGRLLNPTTFAVLTDKGTNLYNGTSMDGNMLADALEHADVGLQEIRRSEGFYGAEDRTTISLNALREIIAYEEKVPGRKMVLWVSPGWPLLSGAGVELDNKQQKQIFQSIVSFSTQLREARVTLYNINSWGANEALGRALYYEDFLAGVSKPGQTQFGNLGLQVLAVHSGGLVLNSSDVKGMLQNCVADVGASYEVTFAPVKAERPDEYHQLSIQVDKPGVTARTQQSYYAQP
jgi:VWFA-related protein